MKFHFDSRKYRKKSVFLATTIQTISFKLSSRDALLSLLMGEGNVINHVTLFELICCSIYIFYNAKLFFFLKGIFKI